MSQKLITEIFVDTQMSKINGGKEGCSAYISDILTEITNKGK
jgi:hypothetical protein